MKRKWPKSSIKKGAVWAGHFSCFTSACLFSLFFCFCSLYFIILYHVFYYFISCLIFKKHISTCPSSPSCAIYSFSSLFLLQKCVSTFAGPWKETPWGVRIAIACHCLKSAPSSTRHWVPLASWQGEDAAAPPTWLWAGCLRAVCFSFQGWAIWQSNCGWLWSQDW